MPHSLRFFAMLVAVALAFALFCGVACASALQQVINFVPVSGSDQRLSNSYCIIEYYG